MLVYIGCLLGEQNSGLHSGWRVGNIWPSPYGSHDSIWDSNSSTGFLNSLLAWDGNVWNSSLWSIGVQSWETVASEQLNRSSVLKFSLSLAHGTLDPVKTPTIWPPVEINLFSLTISKLWKWPRVYPLLCCTVFSCIAVHSGIICFIYPYSVWLLQRHQGSHVVALEPFK